MRSLYKRIKWNSVIAMDKGTESTWVSPLSKGFVGYLEEIGGLEKLDTKLGYHTYTEK
jgi:hypothetical protein